MTRKITKSTIESTIFYGIFVLLGLLVIGKLLGLVPKFGTESEHDENGSVVTTTPEKLKSSRYILAKKEKANYVPIFDSEVAIQEYFEHKDIDKVLAKQRAFKVPKGTLVRVIGLANNREIFEVKVVGNLNEEDGEIVKSYLNDSGWVPREWVMSLNQYSLVEYQTSKKFRDKSIPKSTPGIATERDAKVRTEPTYEEVAILAWTIGEKLAVQDGYYKGDFYIEGACTIDATKVFGYKPTDKLGKAYIENCQNGYKRYFGKLKMPKWLNRFD